MLKKKFKNITVDIHHFCKNPNIFLKKEKKKIITILKNNKPLLHLITPDRFLQLLKIESLYFKKKMYSESYFLKNIFSSNKYLDKEKNENIYLGKFRMYSQWEPDKNFLKLAATWGIHLDNFVKKSELASFITYWKAEGKLYHHIQWQQKLAYSVQFSRLRKKQFKNNITETYEPDTFIPYGFKG